MIISQYLRKFVDGRRLQHEDVFGLPFIVVVALDRVDSSFVIAKGKGSEQEKCKMVMLPYRNQK